MTDAVIPEETLRSALAFDWPRAADALATFEFESIDGARVFWRRPTMAYLTANYPRSASRLLQKEARQ
jgi:hypothetical protein